MYLIWCMKILILWRLLYFEYIWPESLNSVVRCSLCGNKIHLLTLSKIFCPVSCVQVRKVHKIAELPELSSNFSFIHEKEASWFHVLKTVMRPTSTKTLYFICAIKSIRTFSVLTRAYGLLARVSIFYTGKSVEIAYIIENLEDHPKQPER